MSVVFTMPGKIGDALLQWPVAYHYAREHEIKISLWLDEKTLKSLVPLFEAQPCVESVKLIPGIVRWDMGGQPYDFDLKTQDHLDHEIYHLGFRRFPSRQITLETLANVPLNIDADRIAHDPSLFVGPVETDDRVVLHGTFASHQTGVPGFWRFLFDRWKQNDLPAKKYFVGTKAERTRAVQLYPDWGEFDDEKNFYRLAQFIAGSKLVIGAGSSVSALASVLKIPCVRVHDPIGDFPKMIWSGLGENQLNETEVSLRKIWPEWKDKWLATSPS